MQMWLPVAACLLIVGQRAHFADGADYEYSYYGDDYLNGDYPRDWNPDWAAMVSRIPRPKCIDIPENLSLCQNIGYDRMRLPNLLDHDSLSEVTQQAKSWGPLLGIHCHPDTKLFLCSLFSPVCLDRPIFPCRSLCESVKYFCLGRMKAYGFDWPEMLRCEKFPVDNDLCIKQQHQVKLDNNCIACKHPVTYEAIIDNFCQADFVIRARIEELRPLLGYTALILKRKKKFYKKKGVAKKDRKTLSPLIERGGHCRCFHANNTKTKFLIMGNKKDHNFMLSFIIPWQKRHVPFKQSLKAIKQKKEDLCKDIFHKISAGVADRPEKRQRGKKGRRKKKNKNKNKKNKKKKNKEKKAKKGNKGGDNNNRKNGNRIKWKKKKRMNGKPHENV
ncbi:secreted frizzled-related protein 5-like isoform X2 [Gigantopelta aegis]|uniref:secreted frizzled-related protein 5-like isoform X2 n=1 Tax=Gigantopelta aegis TaxID=1735272 RepID=UPI001B88CFA3|nr:secreted frizzled-related protein 5-like isoform X2 [Gigantopelta aegis]